MLVKIFRNSAKYVVSKVDSGALSGALRIAFLRALTIQVHSKIIPESEGKNEFATLKLMD